MNCESHLKPAQNKDETREREGVHASTYMHDTVSLAKDTITLKLVASMSKCTSEPTSTISTTYLCIHC